MAKRRVDAGLRLGLAAADAIADGAQFVRLLSVGHLSWALAVAAGPVVAAVVAAVATLLQAGRGGYEASPCGGGFLCSCACAWSSTFAGFVAAGPQLALQMAVLWAGLYAQDTAFNVLVDERRYWTWPWFVAASTFVSLALSFVCVVTATVRANHERCGRERRTKFTAGLLTTTACVLYRTFVASVMFACRPAWTAAVVIAAFAANVAVCKVTMGRSTESSLTLGYCGLFAPVGFARGNEDGGGGSDTKPGTRLAAAAASQSELQRVRINYEDLLRRTRAALAAHAAVSASLLVPFVVFAELELRRDEETAVAWITMSEDNGEDEVTTSPPAALRLSSFARGRVFVYAPPLTLLALAVAAAAVFYRQTKTLRDATRQWQAITPHRSVAVGRGSSSQPAAAAAAAIDSAGDTAATPSCPPPPYSASPTPPSSDAEAPCVGGVAADGDADGGGRHEEEERARLVQQQQPGSNRCHRPSCVTCEFMQPGSAFKSMMTGKSYRFMTNATCDAKNVIYLVTCANCLKQYVGSTSQDLRHRHYGHRREIEQRSTPLGKHFADECGYANWRIQIIDACPGANGSSLRRREGYWQTELSTVQPWGLNRVNESDPP